MCERVVLDACVLYPALLRDLLLRCAVQGLFAPIWTDRILDEAVRALERRMGADDPRPIRVANAMRQAFPQEPSNQRILNVLVELPDPDDAHVVEAACSARADAIVTLNTRHFPRDILSRLELDVLTPDEFLLYLWRSDSVGVLAALARMSQATSRPHLDGCEIIAGLSRLAPGFAGIVQGQCRESPRKYSACVARCA